MKFNYYSLLCGGLLLAHTVSAQVNSYVAINAISGTSLTMDFAHAYNTSVSGVPAATQAVIMQMQDDVIGGNTANNASFGNLGAISSAGLYEVVRIASVSGTTVTLAAPLRNTYHTGANARVQLISLPAFDAGSGNFTLSATSTPAAANFIALPWDGYIGGVVALQAPNALTIGASLSVAGKGFRGGSRNINQTGDVACDPGTYFTTPSATPTVSGDYYALKGEGIYPDNGANYTRGRGHLLNGGGGGNVNNAGGAGGGNYTAGGDGGPGWNGSGTGCAPGAGGFGGIDLSSQLSTSRIFMGGGGGGGQQNNGVATNGAAGGGILLLIAKSIITAPATCTDGPYTMSAAGAVAANSSNDGSGGGGAGGTVVFQAQTYSIAAACPLTVNLNGGNGGNVNAGGTHGGGGGGGKGAVIFFGSTVQPSNIVVSQTAGTGGINTTDAGATSAASGSVTPSNTGTTNVLTTGATPLPVKMKSFTAQASGTAALLKWETAFESDNSYFAVERSAGATEWEAIGTVQAVSGGANGGAYQFIDGHPAAGRNFYRLNQYDLSGSYEYSGIRAVTFTDITGVTVAPNPVADRLYIQAADLRAFTQVRLTDIAGRTVLERPGFAESENTIDVRHLVPGMYLLQLVRADGSALSIKVAKQ